MHPAKPTVAVAITIAAAIAIGGTSLPEPREPKRLWHIDLNSQGLTHHRLGVFMSSRHDHADSSRNRDSVAINSAGQVAVVFATFQERNGDGYEPGTAKLHLLGYDSATGKSIGAREWSAPEASTILDTPAISATFGGAFLVEYAGRLILYSPFLEIIRSAEIESGRPRFSYWTSPDGRYAFFAGEKNRVKALTIVDTETLDVIRSMSLDRPTSSASSRYLAAWTFPNRRDSASGFRLDVRSDNSGWEQFYSDPGCQTYYGAGVGFLSDAEIIISSCDKLLVIDAGHKVLFSKTFSMHQTMERVRSGSYSFAQISVSSSADGGRFAIALDQPKRDPWWTGDPGTGPVPARLLVYDVSVPGRAVASFELHGHYPSDYDRLGFALSPDGASLALIRDTNLEFFRLPPRTAH